VLESLRQACPSVETIEDEHFFATIADFAHHARGRKQLRMEFFYREVRRRYGILMSGSKPEGGEWNYDAQNRGSFGRGGPGLLPQPASFVPTSTGRSPLLRPTLHLTTSSIIGSRILGIIRTPCGATKSGSTTRASPQR
jgi:hypothetical protein